MPSEYYPKEYPDFMDKLDKPMYESKTVIGKLFRELKKLGAPSVSSKSSTSSSYDLDMVINGLQKYSWQASIKKKIYNSKLRHLMEYFGIKTEAEIVCRGMGMSEPFTKRGEMIEKVFRSLTKEALSWFKADVKVKNSRDELQKASAWYFVTNNPIFLSTEGLETDQFLSFPWCVYDKLVGIKKNLEEQEGDECEEMH